MPAHFCFYLGLALLLLHEMDAVRCHEWRIFPGLSLLPEPAGRAGFLFAHVPLYFLLLWQLTHTPDLPAFIRGFDWFMLIHLGLHLLFLRHPRNEFRDGISWAIIGGAGACGLVDLAG